MTCSALTRATSRFAYASFPAASSSLAFALASDSSTGWALSLAALTALAASAALVQLGKRYNLGDLEQILGPLSEERERK